MNKKMIFLALLGAGLVAGGAASAQAAEVRVGLSGAFNIAPQLVTDTDTSWALPAAGVFISRTHSQSARRDFRSKLGLESLGVPVVRADATWLSRNELYWGGGIGTGVALGAGEGTLFSPLALLNVHGVVGKNFGPWQLEGQARLGLLPSLGLNVSYRIGQ